MKEHKKNNSRFIKLEYINKSKTFAIIFTVLLLLTLTPLFPFVEREPVKAEIFGYTESAAGVCTTIEDKISGSPYTIPEDGTAEYISFYIYMDDYADGIGGNVTCGIYVNSTSVLVGQTETRVLQSATGPAVYEWHNFWFTNGSEPSLVSGTTYLLVAWAESTTGTIGTADNNDGLGYNKRENEVFDNTLPNPTEATLFTQDNISIYCNYSVSVSGAPTQSDQQIWNTTTSSEWDLNATVVSLAPTSFNITINDTEGGDMNITIMTDESGNWTVVNQTSGTGLSNGTYNFTNTSWVDSYDTNYTVSFNVTDGVAWTNETFWFVTTSSPGTSYFVSNTGADSNSGTSQSSPWENISKVTAELTGGVINEGDDIYFNRGDSFDDAQLGLRTGGTTPNPMIIGTYGTGNKPIFNFTGGSAIYCNWAIDNITFQDFNISGNDGTSSILFDSNTDASRMYFYRIEGYDTGHTILIRHCDYYRVEDCSFEPNNSGRHGISIAYGTSNGIIRNCTIKDCKDGINLHFVGSESNNVGNNHWFENITVWNCSEEGFDIAGGIGCENIYIQNCEAYECSNSGMVIGHNTANVTLDNFYSHDHPTNNMGITKTNGTVIIRNSILQNWTSTKNGIVKSGADYSRNITIYNNDIISNGSADYIQINDENVDGFIVKNNIFYSILSASPNTFIYLIAPANLSNINSNWTYNIWWRGDGLTGSHWVDADDASITWVEWQARTETHDEKRQDPKIYNSNASLFNLTSTSPCIDAGDWLTTTNGGSTGTTITIDEANYFFPGISSLSVSGDNIFVGDDLNLEITTVDYSAETITVNRSITWSDGDIVSLSAYNGSSPDIGAREYGVLGGNNDPSIHSEYPTNGSTGISLQPTCSITVNDADGDTMNVTFASDYSGSLTNYQTNSTVGNGTYRWNFTGANNYNTTYNWTVYCDDGTTNISKTYIFTTIPLMEISNPYPSNESISVWRPPANLSAYVNSSGSLSVYIYFQNLTPATDVWTLAKSWSGVGSGRYGVTNLSTNFTLKEFVWGNITYTWSVNITNGATWTNNTYIYTTNSTIGVNNSNARYDVNNDNCIDVFDALNTWNSRFGQAVYNGIYDVSHSYTGNGIITIQDVLYIWNNKE